MIYWIITIIIVLISMQLFKTACGSLSLNKLNTISYVFYFQLIIMTVIGSVFVVTGYADYKEDLRVLSFESKLFSWITVLYSIILMPLSMLFLNKLIGLKNIRTALDKYINKELHYELSYKKEKILLFIFLAISITVTNYVLTANNSIPIIDLLNGDSELAATGRLEVRNNFGGIIYIKNLIGLIMMPIFAYYSFIIYRKYKTFYCFNLFVLLNILTTFLLVYDTQKAPIIFFLVGYIIVLTFVSNGVSKKRLFSFIFLGVFLMVVSYTLTSSNKSGLSQLTRLQSGFYGRLFISGFQGVPMTYEYFPDKIKENTFYVGIPKKIAKYFKLESKESARLLMEYVHPESVKNKTGNLMSSYFTAEAYANYGVFGVLISPIIVGFILQITHLLLIMSRKKPIYIAFYSLITVKWVLISGFVSFLYAKIILYPLILLIIYRVFENTLKKIKL